MEAFLRILIFLSSLTLGIIILKYTNYVVKTVGHSAWAERYLSFGGGGGSYLLWKIIALIIIIAGVVILIKGW